MIAMIFAAGIGSRLKPFTDSHPKALAVAGGKTMLQRTIEKLRDAGARRIVVNVHHFAGQITDYLEANGNFGADIAVSDESALLLDTGGGLLRAEALLNAEGDEPIVLHNADVLTDAPIGEMLARHMATGAQATLLASPRQSSRQLCFDLDGRLRGWRDNRTGRTLPEGFNPAAGTTRSLAFNGVHVVNRDIFPELHRYARAHGEVFSITPFYVDAIGKLDIRAFEPAKPYMWHDIGTPEKLLAAENALRNKGE